MEKRLTFDLDPANYDQSRPRYLPGLFADIIAWANLGPGKTALEIGCGTGQATLPIIGTGCWLTALEPGENLAAFARKKFSGHKNFNLLTVPFERYDRPAAGLDLIYSATAFHWIEERTGYPKAYDLLRSGGSIALFWNIPFVKRPDDPLHVKIDAVYEKYRGDGFFRQGGSPVNCTEKYAKAADALKKYGFIDIQRRIFSGQRTLDADGYISLLNTYSDHIAMPEPLKSEFFAEISAAITETGNAMRIYDTIDLHLAKKP